MPFIEQLSQHEEAEQHLMAITSTIFWRRLDTDGLERLSVVEGDTGIFAKGTILTTEGGGCHVGHEWHLDSNWSVLSVAVSREGADGQKALRLDRTGNRWKVDGQTRPDLDRASEVDLSLTPFCNTLALRRLMGADGNTIVLDTAYIDGVALSVVRSRQAYDRLGNRCFRYRDPGLAKGFEAMLDVDDFGFITRYEGLFERANQAVMSGSLFRQRAALSLPQAGRRRRGLRVRTKAEPH